MNAVARSLWLAGSLGVAAGFVAVWHAVSAAGLVSPVFLPPPAAVGRALVNGFTNGDMLANLAATVARVFGGWLLASLLGIVLGAMIGISSRARIYVAPSLEAIRPLPVSALVPIFIGLLGFTEQMVLAVIAFGALWPTLLSTVHGFGAVEPRLYEVCRSLRLGRWEVIRKIALPSAMPDILAGMRVGLTVSLILVVVAEILGSREGVGYSILLAQRSYQAADIFAGIFLLGCVGYASAGLINIAETRLIYWRR